MANFSVVYEMTPEAVRLSVGGYIGFIENNPWIFQFNDFFNGARNMQPADRMIQLLTVVSGSGWSMNRKGQCEYIINQIKTKLITNRELEEFWAVVDNLPKGDDVLRKLGRTVDYSPEEREHLIPFGNQVSGPPNEQDILQYTPIRNNIRDSFNTIHTMLMGWHRSAGTLCFITKVILMFNWGQSPAFDTRIRRILNLKNDTDAEKFVLTLSKIGKCINDFERIEGRPKLDDLATTAMQEITNNYALKKLPLGRSFDMMLFALN